MRERNVTDYSLSICTADIEFAYRCHLMFDFTLSVYSIRPLNRELTKYAFCLFNSVIEPCCFTFVFFDPNENLCSGHIDLKFCCMLTPFKICNMRYAKCGIRYTTYDLRCKKYDVRYIYIYIYADTVSAFRDFSIRLLYHSVVYYNAVSLNFLCANK